MKNIFLVLISSRVVTTSVHEPAGNISIVKRKVSCVLRCCCRFTSLMSANGVTLHPKAYD